MRSRPVTARATMLPSTSVARAAPRDWPPARPPRSECKARSAATAPHAPRRQAVRTVPPPPRRDEAHALSRHVQPWPARRQSARAATAPRPSPHPAFCHLTRQTTSTLRRTRCGRLCPRPRRPGRLEDEDNSGSVSYRAVTARQRWVPDGYIDTQRGSTRVYCQKYRQPFSQFNSFRRSTSVCATDWLQTTLLTVILLDQSVCSLWNSSTRMIAYPASTGFVIGLPLSAQRRRPPPPEVRLPSHSRVTGS
jgi:hypothetical protein